MSEISDRLKELDEQYKNIIPQAMGRNQDRNPGTPPDDAPHASHSGGMFPLTVFILSILMVMTIAATVIFSWITADKVAAVVRAGDQLEILLEDYMEENKKLERHVKAVELEFRRAFKKDREDMAAMRQQLMKEDAALSDDLKKFSDETRNEVLKYKSTVTDNESRMSMINREYEKMTAKFKRVQNEFEALRAKILALTVPEMPE